MHRRAEDDFAAGFTAVTSMICAFESFASMSRIRASMSPC
jgi:hypothetical protein